MDGDIETYNELAKILLLYAPRNSAVIKLKFVIEFDVEKNETGAERFYFDCVDENGNEDWFVINDVGIPSKIGDLCMELRKKMIENSQGKWSALNFVVDISKNRFTADFDY